MVQLLNSFSTKVFFIFFGSLILLYQLRLLQKENRLIHHFRVNRNLLGPELADIEVSAPLMPDNSNNVGAEKRIRHQTADSKLKVVVLSHEFSLTGAPRVCAELAQLLGDIGYDTSLSILALAEESSVHSMSEIDLQNVANLLPSLSPNYFSFRIHRGSIDGSLSSVVENSDFLIVSTAVVSSSNFVSRLVQTHKRPRKIIWWIHESESVMTALGDKAIYSALDTLSVLGHQSEPHDTVVFPSLAAQAYWVTAALSLPDNQKSNTLSVINAAKVALWGLPYWKLSALRFEGQEAKAGRERARIRLELGIHKDDIVFLSLGTLHALKGHAGIVRAIRCAAYKRNGDASEVNYEKKGNNPKFPRLILVVIGGGFRADLHHFPFSNFKGSEPALFLESLNLPPPAPCSDLKREGDSEEVDDMSWVLSDKSFHFLPAARRIEPYFAMADVFVSNTRGGGETWGLASLEAMGAGLPILAAARGGSLEMVIEGTTGLLHSDEIELVENIRRISDNAEFRRRLGAGAGKRALESFGDGHVLDTVTSVVGKA